MTSRREKRLLTSRGRSFWPLNTVRRPPDAEVFAPDLPHPVALLVYDRLEDKVIAQRALPRKVPSLGGVSISPKGNFFVADFDPKESGQSGSDADPADCMVYDRLLRRGRSFPGVGHSDIAVDAQGGEVLVYQDNKTDHIAMIDLASGVVTALLPIDFKHAPLGFHVSGRALRRPGWALVSCYAGRRNASNTWMDDQIFAVELRRGGRVVRLAHHHSVYDSNQEHDYWAEPHATVNADFTRILFTSNWGRSGTENVETYMIQLPPNWLSQIP